MILIDDILISDEILSEYFLCDLSACKGACCWEGDWGAPLEENEIQTIYDILDDIVSFLPERSRKYLENNEPVTFYKKPGIEGTSLHADGSCVFLTYDELGIARCGIEMAFRNGTINFRKPISCHLYPIRVSKNEFTGFEAMNYDRWEICKAACNLGKREKLPLYKFAREAIIRAYGQGFYDQLEAAADHIKDKK